MLKLRRFKVVLFGILLVALPLWAGAQDALPTLNPNPFQPQSTPVDAGKTEYGRLLAGLIQLNNEVYYSFEGKTGEAVNVDVNTSLLTRVCIRIVTPSGMHLANNTLTASSYYGIGVAILPETGLYKLIIGGACAGSVDGNYQVQIRLVHYQFVEYGTPVEGTMLGDRLPIVYQFQASADEVIFIGLKSEGPGFFLNLLNGKDNSQISSTDAPYDPFIGPLKITEASTYTLMVSNNESHSPMQFTLYIDRPLAQPIQFGVPQEVDFTGEEFLYAYSFTGGYGQVGRLWVDSDGSIDTRFILFTPSSTFGVHEDDDSGTGYDPELEFVNLSNYTQDNDYYIWLLPNKPGSAGHVTLQLDQLEPLDLDQGVVEFTSTSKQPSHFLIFEGHVGEIVELSVEIIQGTRRGLGVTVQQGDQWLANSNNDFVSDVSLSIHPVINGEVLIVVSTQPFNDATLRVSLIRGE